MACLQNLKGIGLSCNTSTGGVSKVYICDYDAVKTVELNEDGSAISGITLENTAKFYPFYFRRGAASMTSTLNIDATNGVNYVSTDLVTTFSRMSTSKRVQMLALAVGQVACIVKDANGKSWYLGYSNPVEATTGTGQTGAAMTDANSYSITLNDSGAFPLPVEFDYSSLVAEVTPDNE